MQSRDSVYNYSYSLKQQRRSDIFFGLIYILVIFLLCISILTFLIFPVSVSSQSMQPKLSGGEIVFATPLASPQKENSLNIPFFSSILHCVPLNRGDIVILAPKYHEKTTVCQKIVIKVVRFVTFQKYDPITSSKFVSQNYCLRRLVAMPGDTVYLKNYVLYVKPADQNHSLTEFELTNTAYNLLVEEFKPEWHEKGEFSGNMDPIILGENEYFVLADNRSHGVDSRYWGAVKSDKIAGKIILRFWPFSKFSAF